MGDHPNEYDLVMEDLIQWAAQALEPAVPDVRIEKPLDGDFAIVLGFPLHFARWSFPPDDYTEPELVKSWTIFIEPQFLPPEYDWRVVAGARIWASPGWGAGLEVGGIAADDGAGGFVGFTIGHTGKGGAHPCHRRARLLSVRAIATDLGMRVDAAIDFAFFRKCSDD